jgi:hypothetical protein
MKIIVVYLREKNEQNKKEIALKLENETFPFWFSCFEKNIKQFGSKNFSVGNKLTISDLKLTATINKVLSILPTISMDQFPLLKSVSDNINQNPKILEYLEKIKI